MGFVVPPIENNAKQELFLPVSKERVYSYRTVIQTR